MLSVNGIHIEKLPFEGLTEISELMSFQDSPVLIHFQDIYQNDIIGYWVDFDISGHRWLYSKISKKELFEFLLVGKSLKDLLSKISADFIFLIDYDLDDNIVLGRILNSNNLPIEYFPKEESYYINVLPDFYENYLDEFKYIMKLRSRSYAIKVSPNGSTYGSTVGAKQAAIALNGFTNSIEGYVKVTAFNLMKNHFGDSNKLNRRINKIINRFSPRIAEAAYNSFEFWLAIDVVGFSGEDNFDSELKRVLVDGYKNDVLDIDYNSEIDANIIAEKYSEDERKLIYEPIIKIVENKDFSISIGTNIAIRKKTAVVNKNFRDIILPPPTLEQVEAELNKKNVIFQIIVNLKEGDDLSKISKKELQNNMVFEGQIAQSPYKIDSPIIANGVHVNLKMPLNCILEVSENGGLQIYNSSLDIFFESHDIHEIVINLKSQFVSLYQKFLIAPEDADSKFLELKKYLL